MTSRNIRLLIEYDGTDFVGWQAQDGLPTVQGHVTTALERVVHDPNLRLVCAGRTDAGVHAYGQVAAFFTPWAGEARRLTPALNYHLPSSIRVHESVDAAANFDPRKSAHSKRYLYRIYQGRHGSALQRRRAWHVRRPIDLHAMEGAAAYLQGELDFNAFRSSQCDAAHAVRHMFNITVQRTPLPPMGCFVDITFHANAFCRHMCRILAGTLVEVGTGRRSVVSVSAALAGRDRRHAGVTAPPWGLYLMEVLYQNAF